MVARWILILLVLPLFCFAQDLIKVTAQVEGEVYEDEPVKGTITITRKLSQNVEANSFRIQTNPLNVQFVKNVPLSDTVVLSLYEFSLEPMIKGFHVLPEISVTVDGTTYRTIPATFTVREQRELPAQEEKELLLELQAVVDGPKTLYPGQRTKLVYRYIFNTNLEMTKEELPLLDATGFKKIGEKQFKEKTEGSLNVLEISQEIEAIRPGTFTFDSSFIEGKAYTEDKFGRKLYSKQKLTAKAPSVTVTVLPFVEKEKPASFNGAVGNFAFEVKLLSKSTVFVGDKITLLVRVSGTGEFEKVEIPDLCCQPGFPGNFRLSDIPPKESVKNGVKEFVVDMRPLTSEIKEIPSVAFSFFNPDTKKYATLQSKPIPIKVMPLKEEEFAPVKKFGKEKTPDVVSKPEAIEIFGNYPLTEEDLRNSLFGVWYVLFIIPIGAIFLIYLRNLKNYLEKQKERPLRGKDYFKEAMALGQSSPFFYDALTKAFLFRLKETGEIQDASIALEELPKTGRSGNVYELLQEIDEKRFSGKEEEIDAELLRKIKNVFKEL